tara:strand:+ start:2671 stop:3942 length:1272 start_codon:yes stop_codon:yes gene_type:complete
MIYHNFNKALFSRILCTVLILLLISACSNQPKDYHPGHVVTLSVSSDGQYVISAGEKGGLLLWNIKERNYQVISTSANPLTPYFIHNTHNYLWQSNDNVVHVDNINGKELLHFKSQKSYSNVMTSDRHYFFMTDVHWKFYRYNTETQQWKKLYNGYLSYMGEPLNLSLNSNDQFMLSSGVCDKKNDEVPVGKPRGMLNLDCVTRWNVQTGKPIRKYWGNVNKTVATFSPDNKYILAVDEDSHGYIWNLAKTKSVKLWSLSYGIPTKHNKYGLNTAFDRKGLLPIPKDFKDYSGEANESMVSAKYITKNEYLRFDFYIDYAVLYQGLNPKPTQYLKLGYMPFPSTNDFSRDQSIDTSPSAHVLVTGQGVFDGINVYKFDPKTKTLYRVWTPILHKPPQAPPISKDVPTLPGVKFADLTKVKQVG